MASNYPQDLLYTKDHEWCRIEGDVATIGITWHAQNALGDVVYCELPAAGAEVKQGGTFGVVESVKAVSDLYAPVTGKVLERNEKVVSAPEVLNQDSYSAGWMIRVKMSDKAEAKSLLDAKAYVATLESD
jgi:glycine cleavage system H protein